MKKECVGSLVNGEREDEGKGREKGLRKYQRVTVIKDKWFDPLSQTINNKEATLKWGHYRWGRSPIQTPITLKKSVPSVGIGKGHTNCSLISY